MRIDISPLAERDLEAIGDYIAADNPPRALSFVAELRTKCANIAKSPQAYRARPELGKDIRSCPHRNYVIFFTATKARLTIVRVLHGAMDVPTQFGAAKLSGK
ncbi:MAG TPA: type II toxin-antitoxin system RelE/ParE family toxin [Candidatus Binataceae bacterium]|nr:type II toxin-antitoxin system RelE/ParE family toxin [Candidatus Binataceae bacterium]